MEVHFKNKKLAQLYENGSSNKYKLTKRIVESFFEVLVILEASHSIHDLWALPSLNFEKLSGYEDRYSVRLNKQFRLEMTIDWTNTECTVGFISIEEISNHYGGK